MKIGSLCSGYGGLDLGVREVLGGEVAWHAEYDRAPSKILEYHWPEVPNYGDLTALDWASLPPVDVITAGYPCQPFSMLGKRKGAADERHLWPYVIAAIRHLRPRIVVLENVRGHLTLGFDRVLGDLAEAGYDTQWICVPAAAAGAPHRRERVFILAYPADVGHEWAGDSRDWRVGSADRGPSVADTSRLESERRRVAGRLASTTRGSQGTDRQRQRHGDAPDDRGSTDWGEYAAAIRWWELILGRPAPAPTSFDGRGGKRRLSPRFVEWMMGLPEGHVTDVGLTRAQQLKALGNGVVPQQAALALRLLGVSSVG